MITHVFYYSEITNKHKYFIQVWQESNILSITIATIALETINCTILKW